MIKFYDSEADLPHGMEYVKDNVVFFKSVTEGKLDNHVNEVLENIDGSVYFNQRLFKSKFGETLSWDKLSTGGMTALNIVYNKDKAFWLGECGVNALCTIKLLQEGNAVW